MKERKKEIKIKLSTFVYLFIIFVLVIALIATYYLKKENHSTVENNITANNVNDNTTSVSNIKEMSKDLAYSILKKYKDEKLKDANWNLGRVELVAHGDNNTYLVSYEEMNNDYVEKLTTVIQLKDGEWTTKLPGASGYSDDSFAKYNFVYYGQKLVQFDTDFFDIEEIAKEYRECDKIKNYKDFKYDLDGDGVKDKITIKKIKDEQILDSDEYIYVLELNGKRFAEYIDEVYIVDLNKSDSNIEVIYYSNEPSDDPHYCIYSKKGNKMVELETIWGAPLKSDEKGTFVVGDEYNGAINPEFYFDYYTINNGKIEQEQIDINKFKDIEFTAENLYFSNDFKNLRKFWEEAKSKDEDGLKDFDIEKLDEKESFKIIDFKDATKEEWGEGLGVRFKIYVELSDGRKGYVFYIQWAG